MLATATPLDAQAAKIVVLLAATCSICCFCVVVLPSLADAVGWLRVESRHKCVALVALALACLVWAQKPDGGCDDGDLSGGTNDVSQVSGTNDTDGAGLDGMGPLMMMGSMAPDLSPVIDATDIARGYRLESSTVNGQISYEMPEGVSPAGTWHLTGAYDDVLSVDLDGFVFPLGRELCSSLWAHTWGTARPHVRNLTNELVAVGVPMSALPGFSRFWTAQTTNDTFLLTWENFTLGRIPVSSNASSLIPDPSSLLSAQLELFRSGDFIARSNDVESVYRRINPDDWDDDGDPNEDDINPLVCDGSHFGPHQVLSEGANSNAYCWVDLVVRQANARMVFSGDGASDLPDPSFIAKVGETNRVIILIGKTYVVTCDMPFEVVGKSDGEIGEWWEADRKLWLNWPVEIWSHGDDEMPLLLMGAPGLGSHGPKSFTMFVSPSNLGGGFTWTNYCCSLSGKGYMFSYGCNGTCSCSGCSAQGYYKYEGYQLGASGGSCGCTGNPEENPNPGPSEPSESVLGFVGVNFSKSVIFFEDEYANTPQETVPWHSTESALCCSASGGQYGGHVKIEISGADNLVQYGGYPLPFEVDLDPYEEIAFTNTYRAVAASASAEAIVARGSFVPDDVTSQWRMDSMDKATAVKVEIEPATVKPGCVNRHIMGVREIIRVFVFPSDVSANITIESGWSKNEAGDDLRFICPLSNSNNGLTIGVEGCSYAPNFQIFKPQSIVCRAGRVCDLNFPVGTASGIGMQIEPIVEPESVAFTGIRMMERPTLVGASPPTGYFNVDRYSAFWAHTSQRGAGVWRDPNAGNLFFLDTVSFGEPCPQPWSAGTIDWDIEIGWGDKDAVSLVDVVEDIPIPYHQITTISSDGGVKVEKYEQWVKRMPSGTITHSDGISD